ncbi:hypothetical protein [Citreimonas salinaria]|uniref:Uncharacterized protein n=1 Tax=Citreimonas salinaria TaxID=321339 RepID=A0A1H3LL37_9RHOB|nr:hypothetical protein [Citreimonas salinaria]SDY65093.1 hypothetical protein SAMN05444340_11375 [Citreimonas salinaria]
MTFEEIKEKVRDEFKGVWFGRFERLENGYEFKPTGDVITSEQMTEIMKSGSQGPKLSPEERKRNRLRGIADSATEV